MKKGDGGGGKPSKGPSPTGIIDLTADSDSDMSDADQEERLGGVRKRLAGSNNNNNSAGSGGGDSDSDGILEIYTNAGRWTCQVCTYTNWNVKTTCCEMCGVEKKNDEAAVSEEEEQQKTEDGSDDRIAAATATATSRVASSSKKRKGAKNGGDSTSTAAAAATATAKPSAKKIKKEGDKTIHITSKQSMSSDGVEIVAPQAPKFVPAAAAAAASSSAKNNDDGDDDDEVVLEGVANEQRFPHMRPHCTTCKFDDAKMNYTGYLSRSTITTNSESCDLCFCYVCDCPQSQCDKWMSESSYDMNSNHCCASDKDYRWVSLRANTRFQKTAAAVNNRGEDESSDDENEDDGVPRPPPGFHFMASCSIFARNGYCGRCWCYVCDRSRNSCSNTRSHKSAKHSSPKWRYERERRKLPTYGRTGPWKPDDQQALADFPKDKSLIQCLHCKWFMRLKKSHVRCIPSSEDWCIQCGLVAVDKDFGKDQEGSKKKKTRQPYDSDDSDDSEDEKEEEQDRKDAVDDTTQAATFLLGTKSFPFTIKAHDPRKIYKYKQNWTTYSQMQGWTYSTAAQRKEVFLHRLGKAPKLSNLMRAIPIAAEKKIVDEIISSDSAHMEDTDAIIVKDRKMVSLMNMLNRLPETCVRAKLDASWNPASQSGKINLEVFLHNNVFVTFTGSCQTSLSKTMSCVLALWFENMNFSLSDLTGPSLKPEKTPTCLVPSTDKDMDDMDDIDDMDDMEFFFRTFNYRHHGNSKIRIPLPPFELQKSEMKKFLPKISKSFKPLISYASKHFKDTRDNLSLVGSEASRYQGGTSPSPSDDDLGLKGNLSRYFGEHIHNLIYSKDCYQDGVPSDSLLMAVVKGLSSIHRGSLRETDNDDYQILFALLGVEKATAAKAMLHKDASAARRFANANFINAQAVVSTVKRLENLGHHSFGPHDIDGFVESFELLPFQRQSLKWAVERELTPGGIQSYWWPKLPSNSGRTEDLYFCPILNSFRKDPPRVVKGGLICEEMGLGKTVISLGLILKNPAPASPDSGSNISALDSNTGANATQTTATAPTQSTKASWDTKLYRETSKDNAKRGSIISRGTLVVCPVSLVGQWIEEAKSKLADPGLVYPYHGGNRTRNASVLAKNAIVVTTYNVLASDKYYHSTKGGNANNGYCAPLEEVRWWRILYDEGHCLRDAATKNSKAAAALVGDIKWIITGTPISTNVNDLKNMLKVIGIEHVDRLFKAMIANSSNRRGMVRPAFYDINSFMYFLRPILLRHSQQMKYRGSDSNDTTLMQLPEKTERMISVKLSPEEKKAYRKMEADSQKWYMEYRKRHRHDMSKHYLTVSSRLIPLRDASSGGKYSLGNDQQNVDDELPQRKSDTVLSDFTFTSKLKVLLQELDRTKIADPTSKSLIFTQFKTTLDWLKEELPKHGFSHRSLSGDMSMKARAKSLHDFQNDPPTTVFLLSMRAGAVGINLTQANNVYILEPHMNPAVEAQAIGRVHRLGQKRKVLITRLIVENSVESRMLNFLEQKYSISEKDLKSEKDDNASENEDSSVSKDGEDKNIEEKQTTHDKKDTVENTVVGNLTTEKAAANLEQWDLLFGVEEKVKELEEQERQQREDRDRQRQQEQENAAMPDAVGSGPDHVSSSGRFSGLF